MERLRARVDRLAAAAHAVRRPAIDVAVVLLTLAFTLEQNAPDGPSAWAFDLALVLPLLWRRRHPFAVFLVIFTVALLQLWLQQRLTGDLEVLIALYSVGAHESRTRHVVVTAVLAEIGVLLAALRWNGGLDDAVLLTGTGTAGLMLGVYLRTRRAYVVSVVERAATAERERDQQALLAAAAERARISREMHDIVAHSLSVMIALGDGAAIALARSPDTARSSMLQSSVLGRQALGEMRRLLGDLHEDDDPQTQLAPQPGVADLDDLVEQVRSAGPAVTLVVIGQPRELSAGAGLTVYRVVQEALTNVLKHAPSATRVEVTLRHTATGVDIAVDNDDTSPAGPAAGLPTSARTATGRTATGRTATAGQGLSGMRQRAAAFGGTVEAGRRPDGGWHVGTRLRLDEQDAL